MCIYADFNGLENVIQGNKNLLKLNLTGYGTLASLSFDKIILKEKQILKLCDPDGLFVYGEVYFDKERIRDNCSGWFAHIKKDEIRDDGTFNHDFNTHLCFKCRRNIKNHLDRVGRQYHERCPFCNTEVMFPMLPPQDQ